MSAASVLRLAATLLARAPRATPVELQYLSNADLDRWLAGHPPQ